MKKKKKKLQDVKRYCVERHCDGTPHNKYINLCRISDLENDIIHFNTDISFCLCFSHFECILYNSVVHTL